MKVSYAIRKNGLYLDGLFGHPVPFGTKNVRDCYVYDTKLIALDVAHEFRAEIVPVYKPNEPFGDYVLLAKTVINEAITSLEFAAMALKVPEKSTYMENIEQLKELLNHV